MLSCNFASGARASVRIETRSLRHEEHGLVLHLSDIVNHLDGVSAFIYLLSQLNVFLARICKLLHVLVMRIHHLELVLILVFLALRRLPRLTLPNILLTSPVIHLNCHVLLAAAARRPVFGFA